MSIINENFILKNESAKKLYNEYAKNMPIIDYHCHISPREIYEDRRFENLTQVWLGGDHYKWRLIRSNAVDENDITGDADDYTKFLHFAKMLPLAIGNPMYHWTHLELKKYFDYDGILNERSAKEVWEFCNERLKCENMSARGLIEASNVEVIGTTDDPIDDLHWHKLIAEDTSFKTKVIPSYRPDKAINIEKAGFSEYIKALSDVCGFKITTIQDVKKALSERLEFFVKNGCRASDHGLDYAVYSLKSEKELNEILSNALSGKTVNQADADAYKTELLLHLGREYARHGVVMQIHYGAIRNTNTKMFKKLGPDTGFDCISTHVCGEELVKFLDALEKENVLPKTVLYSLNPQDNAMLDTFLGAFQGTEVKGKLQHGSAWWFNDTKRGMEEQLKSLAELSLLGNFIGMLTDSRSFLSYTRHDYFRRILCNLIGEWVETGEYPDDQIALKEIVEGICYKNAKKYFNL